MRLEVLEDRCLLAAPVAVNDFYATPIDTPFSEPAPGVLANDTDPDGDAFQSIQVNFTGVQGFVVITTGGAGLGAFSYSPPAGFTGIDSFSYQVTDTNGEQSNVATVTIFVGTPPVGQPDVYATPENTTLDVFPFEGVLVNDVGFPIQAVLVDGPANGSLSLFGNGSFTYTPALDYTGPDSFTYKPWDGVTPLALIDPVTVFLFVNDVDEVPVANVDFFTVNEDETLVPPAPGVLINDFSPDGLPLTALLVSGPSNIAPGSFTLNPDGSFAYTPLPDFFGNDSFVYRAIDSRGMASEETTVFLTILPVNDAPTAVDDEFTVNEDETLFVAGPGVLANDTDPENDVLASFVVAAPTNGSLSLSSDGSFVYTPNPNFNGTDTFTYRVSDGNLPSANVATVTINVLPVNDVPVARDDIFATSEDVPLVVADPGVLANDTDEDGDVLSAVLVTNPLHGVVTLNANGSFTYTPNPLFNGVDSFTYRASDGQATSEIATVTILVGATNNAPTANDDAFETSEGQALVVAAPGVLGNDTDPDGDLLSSFVISNPTNGTLVLNSDGSFSYTPNANFAGTDSFTYRAFDGTDLSNVATVTITVVGVPGAPVANDDTYQVREDRTLTIVTPGILLNDLNPDGGTVTITVINGPLYADSFVMNNDGSFVYTPEANFNGTDNFTYILTNDSTGLTSNAATVTIIVRAEPDVPVANPDSFTTNEDVPLSVSEPGVLANDINVDGGLLQAVIIAGPSFGSVLLESDGSFVYTPDPNFNGTDSFTYIAVNGAGTSAPATVTIVVRPVADTPVALDDAYTTERGTRLTVLPPGILGNDSDNDAGTTLTAVLVNPPQNGTLVLNPNGGFVYTPNANFAGTDSFTYRASDGVLTSNLATVSITVQQVAPPTITLDPASDTGISQTDRITSDNTPTFLGTGRPGQTITILAQASGAMSPVEVGSGVVDSAGMWQVTTLPLADGTYAITAVASNPDGLVTDTVAGGSITIDTVAPVVTDALLAPKTGQVYITFQDDRVGMAQPTIVNVANYSFSKIYSHTPRAFAVNSARALPAVEPTAAQTVVLDVFGGRHLTHGRYLLAALAGGIADVAGNALDGDFYGTYPSGNGAAGGNFQGQFNNNGRDNSRAIATTEFVPIVSAPPGRAPSIPTPVARTPNRGPTGPLALTQARQEALKPRYALWLRSTGRSSR